MSEKIFEKILMSKINSFVQTYSNDSKNIFVDKDGRLIHPGEFGTYREKIVSSMLRCIVPHRLDIGTGFIITADGKVSTQCDIIIYDKNHSPLIENTEYQRFYPIESVVAVGEIKSDLSKEKLKDALFKLKNFKMLRKNVSTDEHFIYRELNGSKYSPEYNPYDQITTFLICNKFNFNYENIVNEMNDIYSQCDNYLRHNMILSINDGCLMYKDKNQQFMVYPIIGTEKLRNSLLKPTEFNIYDHIVMFLNYLYMSVSSTTILYPDMSCYIDFDRKCVPIDEKIE